MAAVEDPSDEELVARIVSGDREAFAALYRRRRSDVYRFALHVSGSAPVADDVTQDVFMAGIYHPAPHQPGPARGVGGVVRHPRQPPRGAPRPPPRGALSRSR